MAGDETPIQDVFVSNVMCDAVESVPADLPAVTAARRLFDSGIGSLLVDGDEALPAGIVTETDFVELVAAERDPATTPVEDCMSSPVLTVSPATQLSAAAEIMAEENVKKLPVVRDDTQDVVGIITTTDIAKYLPIHEFHPED